MRIVPVCRGAVAAAGIAALSDVPLPDVDLPAVTRLPAARRGAYRASRVLLRRLVWEVIGSVAAASPLAAGERGRPYLVARPDIGISISHTDGWVAAAVHPTTAVGVDVQAPTPVEDRLLRRCCTPSARAALAQLPGARRAVEFARIWSVQEACVKAAGAGIAGLPWTIPVEVGQRHGTWGRVGWTSLSGRWPVPASFAHVITMEAPCRCRD
jgi:4'-phosphopantetheinyl transferase